VLGLPEEIGQRMIKMRNEEGLTFQAIADRLNEEGIRGPKGGLIQLSSVYKYLKDNQQRGTLRLKRDHALPRPKMKPGDKRCYVHREMPGAPLDCPDCAAGVVWPRDGKLTQFASKAEFLRIYPMHASITKTCEVLNLKRTRVAGWISKDKNFAEAFAEAKEMAADILETTMYRLSVEGYDEPVYQGGIQVGFVTKYMPNLMMFLAKSLRPEKFREQQKIEHTGPDGGPIQIEAVRERFLGRLAVLADSQGSDGVLRLPESTAEGEPGNGVEVLGKTEPA